LRHVRARQAEIVFLVAATIAEQEAHREQRVELGRPLDLVDFGFGKLDAQSIWHGADVLDGLDAYDWEDVGGLLHEVCKSLDLISTGNV
jgi:hypothetical protein